MVKMRFLLAISVISLFCTVSTSAKVLIDIDDYPELENAKNELADFVQLAKLEPIPTFKLSIDSSLADEQWSVKRMAGGQVEICGGSDRGTLYGVYEFLEKVVGIRFYGSADTFVPQDAKEIPQNFNYSGKPSFKIRFLSLGNHWDADHRWYARNRIQGPRGKPEYGAFFPYGSPGRCHTYGLYTTQPDFPDKPECYAQQSNGSRPAATSGHGPGQPCLSNPEVLAFFKRKLHEFIAKDQAAAREKGHSVPIVYNVSANDNGGYCRCQLCKKAWERTGGPGGLDLEFVNSLAESIEEAYPDLILECFAYMYSEQPEKIKARHNVRVQMAQLGHEFGGIRNTLLSLKSPSNAQSLKLIRGWTTFAQRLAVWDYGTIYNETFPTPYTKVRGYAETFSEYVLAGVESVYVESEIHWRYQNKKIACPQSFCDLKNYTACRLMLDANTDVEALIDEYMQNSYGEAAPFMLQYLNYLEERQNQAQVMNMYPAEHRLHFDYDFFVKAEELFAAAENAVKDSPEKLFRISRERFNVDYAMLGTWKKHLKDKPFPLSLKEIESRLIGIEEQVVKTSFPPGEHQALLENGKKRRYLLMSRAELVIGEVPDFINKEKVVADFFSGNFDANRVGVFVEDKEAFLGNAFKLPDVKVGQYTNIHEKPFELGIYSNDQKKTLARKVFTASELPQDEKYHWFGFHKVQLTVRCRMWGNFTWGLSPAKRLHEVFDSANPTKTFDVWISYKLTGPAYVKESKSKNAAYIDRVIVTVAD